MFIRGDENVPSQSLSQRQLSEFVINEALRGCHPSYITVANDIDHELSE